jgi:hypothetical protein
MDSSGGQAEKAEYGLANPKCPNCKADLAHGAQLCVECGTALATGAKLKSAAQATKKKGVMVDGGKVKKIAIGVIVAAAVCVGGYNVYKFFYPMGLWHPTASRPAVQFEKKVPPAVLPNQRPHPGSPTSK